MVTPAVFARIGRAVHLSVVGYRSTYTIASWLFGWCVRLMFQVLFFSTVGLLVGGPRTVEYLLIGNVVAIAALEASTVVVAMTREHHYGTLVVLAAAPGHPALPLLAGNISWPFTGVLSAAVTACGTMAVFGSPFTAGQLLLAVPLVLACALAAYCLGAAVGALVLSRPSTGFTAMNVVYLSVMTFTGVNVPVDFWPDPVAWVARLMPVTHGLTAVRALLDDGPVTTVLTEALWELAVAGLWLSVAVVLIRRAVAVWRRRGSLDLPG